MNKFFQSFKDNYKIILSAIAFTTLVTVGMHNRKQALVNGVPTKPDFMYDATGDGVLDGFYMRQTNSLALGILSPTGGHLEFIDGTQLEKTVDGSYKRHANLLRINGSAFVPKASYKLPLTLLVGEFDGKKGVDAKVVETSPDLGVNYTTNLNNLRIPHW